MTSVTNPSFDKTTEAVEVAKEFPEAIKDRAVLITGVNRAGIGFATAQALASQSPSCLILAGRSSSKVNECRDLLSLENPDIDIRVLIVDLSSRASVRSAAAKVLSWDDVPAIHLVINNAGLMRHGDGPDGGIPVTEDGIEDMFATNHLGHFLLTNLLMPKIIAGSTDTLKGSTRIINISSSGTWISPLRVSDIEWKTPAYKLPENERPNFAMMRQAGMKFDEDTATYIPTAAYCHSKTCNILFSVGLNKRLFEKHSILSLAVNPGEVKTELGRNTDPAWLARAIKTRESTGMMHWKSPGQGASTTLTAACDPRLSLPDSDGRGQYLNDCQIANAPAYATDAKDAERLWQISERMTEQTFAY